MRIILNNKPIYLVDIGNCDLFGFDEIQNHKIHNCHCRQCRASKKNKHKNTKKLFKRFMNKKRRQITLRPKHYTNYWA